MKLKQILGELSLIDKARDIAQLSHLKQKRVASGKPYIVHPERVLSRAKAFGLSKDEQIIAVLHDVYEDSLENTKSSVLNKIESMFGKSIANAVYLYKMLLRKMRLFRVVYE